ncbi:MAG: CCA tRNA nucleotidyltransferase [Rubripirellula sp.]
MTTIEGTLCPFPFLVDRTIDADTNPFLQGPRAAEALRIIQELREAGFVAYLAGGCVRDALLAQPPKDYDVATDATPESVRDVFGKRNTIAFGASFGVIGVLPPRGQVSGGTVEPTEVATFRSDGFYSDGRRPDSVHYGDAMHDAQRRDFTINGLFYDPFDQVVIDYVEGQADLERGVLRTIGDPLQRFGEDKLRMLRAIRFATTLGFEIEPATQVAIVGHADDIAVVSGERIGAEMRRILVSPNAAEGLRHLVASRLQSVVLPELNPMWPDVSVSGVSVPENSGRDDSVPGGDGRPPDQSQTVASRIDRFEQMVRNVQPRSFSVVLACLALVTEDWNATLAAIGKRWRLSNEESRRASAALKHHETIQNADRLPWSTVQPILIQRDVETIVAVAAAVASVDGHSSAGAAFAQGALAWSPDRLNPPPLLTGADLATLGIPSGPRYRTILHETRVRQLDGQILTRDEAIAAIKDAD